MITGMLAGVLIVAGSTCQAGLYTESYTPNATIPEGNPVGLIFADTVSGIPSGSILSGLIVTLDVSGGYNGDFVISLRAPNGGSVSLLDQPGVTGGNPYGYGGSGLNLTLSDAALNSIQSTPETPGAVMTGTYQAAGESLGVIWFAGERELVAVFCGCGHGCGQSDVEQLQPGNNGGAGTGEHGAGCSPLLGCSSKAGGHGDNGAGSKWFDDAEFVPGILHGVIDVCGVHGVKPLIGPG